MKSLESSLINLATLGTISREIQFLKLDSNVRLPRGRFGLPRLRLFAVDCQGNDRVSILRKNWDGCDISRVYTHQESNVWPSIYMWLTWTNDVLKTCDFYLINKRVLYVSVCRVYFFLFFFVFYKRPREIIQRCRRVPNKKIEINQITKLTKREKIVIWSNRVYAQPRTTFFDVPPPMDATYSYNLSSFLRSFRNIGNHHLVVRIETSG